MTSNTAPGRPGSIVTVAGDGRPGPGAGDTGPAVSAHLNQPYMVALAPDARLFIADFDDQRVRMVDANGLISTAAGTGVAGSSGDNGPGVMARLNYPLGIAVGPDGSAYIADTANHRVRRLSPDGTMTTLAGSGEMGYSGDDGPAVRGRLNNPSAIAVAADGAVYIAERDNHCIRRATPDGLLTTFAGTGQPGFSGDGGSVTRATLRGPTGLSFDPDGRLFIADSGNYRVRRVDPDGKIVTVAGIGERGYSGDGGPATAAALALRDVSCAPDGSLYIADYLNHRIRLVRTDGLVMTVAGTGTRGFAGDNDLAIHARLNYPGGVAADASGVYIGDSGNKRVRYLSVLVPSGSGLATGPRPSEPRQR